VTGKRVFCCRVVGMDPELEGWSRETVVKILADRMNRAEPHERGAPGGSHARRQAGMT
jgi:hypothetical protein